VLPSCAGNAEGWLACARALRFWARDRARASLHSLGFCELCRPEQTKEEWFACLAFVCSAEIDTRPALGQGLGRLSEAAELKLS